MIRKLGTPLIICITFWIVAIVLWQTKGQIFFLYNFGYIGTAIGVGISLYTLLPRKKKPSGRRLSQLLIGIYMLCFLGLLKRENMQLEGFFLYLLSGFFAGSAIHYMVAKIAGPIFFGRGFCGWACWTAMVLDFLPYKRNTPGRISARWELLRYLHFGISLLSVLILWLFFEYRPNPTGNSELVSLAVGNSSYYISAVILAFALKDNRAFCKYICPITVILKLTSRLSLLKIEGDRNKCVECGACVRACPMDIDIMEYVKQGKRVLSTECVFCLTCTSACPEEILESTLGLDMGGKEMIHRRQGVTTTSARPKSRR